MEDEEGLRNVLSRMRAMGCRYTQLQWIGRQIPAETIAALLKEYDIQALSVQDKAPQVFADAEYYLTLCEKTGAGDLCASGAAAIGEDKFIRRMSDLHRQTSFSLSYHPIGKDFEGALDVVMTACPFLKLTLDSCQAQDASRDAAEIIKKYAGRIDFVHFKDRDENGELCPVGTGKIDFEKIADACVAAQVHYIFAEQETWRDAYEEIGQGFAYTARLCGQTM